MEVNTSPRHFRIFISSPGDVPGEREFARHYIKNKLAYLPSLRGKISCEVIAWDDPDAEIPMFAGETPQESVNNARWRPAVCDIVVVMLWSRIGTPLPAEITKPDGSRYESGTEWEYLDAMHSESPKKPEVLVYRRTEEPSIGILDPDLEAKREQYKKALAFFEQFKNEDGSLKGGVNEYGEVEEFERLLAKHLQEAIEKILKLEENARPSGDKKKPKKTTSRPQYQPPSPELRARYLTALRNHSLQIPLAVLGDELDFKKQIRLDQVFINLEVTQKNLDDLQQEDHWTRHGEGEPMLALDAINKHDRVVLLGDPGSGKSSLVKHLVAEMAAKDEGLLPVFLVLRDLAPVLQQTKAVGGFEEQQAILANVIIEQAKEHVRTILHVPEFADGVQDALMDEKAFLVLDGLDEVPYEAREVVRNGVAALLNRYNVPRVIITCRIRSYTGKAVFTGVPTYTLAPLKEELITAFVERWYDAQCSLGRVEKAFKEERIGDLNKVATSEPLLSLARNPMLLTTMTIIHQQDTVLPRERVKLYQKAVDLLLKKWQLDMGKLPEELKAFLESRKEKMRPMMERLAFEAHSPGNEASDLQRMETINLLADPMYLGKDGLAEQFLDYVDHRSGLLIGRGGTPERPTLYSFPHRTFQEYLAGAYLIGFRGAAQRLRDLAADGDFWSEAVLLGIEEQVYNSGSYGQNHVLNLASQLSQKEATDEESSRLLLWTSKMAKVVGADVVAQDPGDIEPGAKLLARLREGLVGLQSGHLPPIERAEAGRTLARLGDHRKELMTLEAMPFSYVPAGPFLMGDEKAEVDVPYGYWISRYPVTQAQFKEFVDAGGYEDKQWWTKDGLRYKRSGLRKYSNPIYQLPNHPVVGVMWYEAYAFTQWLTRLAVDQGWVPAGTRILLPNEPEWEKAARGGLSVPLEPGQVSLEGLTLLDQELVPNEMPGRRYPWGEDITPNHCSYNETEIGTTSMPGCFPLGVSPYGVEDMSGNVREWGRSKGEFSYKGGSFEQWKDLEDEKGSERRVVRGGSFGYSDHLVRCSFRRGGYPDGDSFNRSFRVVALPPSE